MVTSTKTFRKLSTATAVVALAGGVFGVGVADAQERSEASSIDQFVQMSSSLLPGFGGNSAPAPQAPVGSDLIQLIPENADQLKDDRLAGALNSTLQAEKNPDITVDFREDGALTYNDGCNSGNGTYQIDNTGALRISDLTETKMACEPGAQKDADDVKSVLETGPQVFQIDASTLFLSGQGQGIEFQKMHGHTLQ